MKKKTRQKIGQAILTIVVNGMLFAWIWYGLATATTLN